MASIRWRALAQPEFDQRVETICVAYNADLGKDAYAVNGRGGDGGIDIQIRRDGRLTVVQMKFFPEGIRLQLEGPPHSDREVTCGVYAALFQVVLVGTHCVRAERVEVGHHRHHQTRPHPG